MNEKYYQISLISDTLTLHEKNFLVFVYNFLNQNNRFLLLAIKILYYYHTGERAPDDLKKYTSVSDYRD